jgi:ribosomal protein S18 acetylase RimI-like enzyme
LNLLSKIKIRAVDSGDLQMLSQIASITFNESFAAFNTPENMCSYINEHFNESALKTDVENDSNLYYLIYTDQQAVGYMKLRFNSSIEGIEDYFSIEIERIYILKNYHKQGLGKRLIQKAIQIAKENNYNLLWLAVWEHNTNAIAFYEHMGFTRFSTKTFVLGNDVQNDICYKLKIDLC